MMEFDTLVRAYLVAAGLERIQVRAGSGLIEDVDLSGVLPYLAWKTNVLSRILTAQRPLEMTVLVDLDNRCLRCLSGIEVLDSRHALTGLSCVLADYEDGDLRRLDDAVSDLLRNHASQANTLSETQEVNAGMLRGYYAAMDHHRLELQRVPGHAMDRGAL